MKVKDLKVEAEKIELIINNKKIKEMFINHCNISRLVMDGVDVECIQQFSHLRRGRCRHEKLKGAFAQLRSF